MLTGISNMLMSIVDFFQLVFSSAYDFISSIPKFMGYINSIFNGVPACLVGFCGVALSLLLANKILSLI